MDPTPTAFTPWAGLGWGLSGFCPGPGLTALATLQPGVIAFAIAFFAGAALWRFVFAR